MRAVNITADRSLGNSHHTKIGHKSWERAKGMPLYKFVGKSAIIRICDVIFVETWIL